MRFKATLWALGVTAVTTLHGLVALWCYHHILDNVIILVAGIAIIWAFVGQALYCARAITVWLNIMFNPNKYAD